MVYIVTHITCVYIILHRICCVYITEYVYKIPDNLMCNLQPHNCHLRAHTYIQKTSILTTCMYFIEYNGTLNFYVHMATCFSFFLKKFIGLKGTEYLH
jgi:hypothetical protein